MLTFKRANLTIVLSIIYAHQLLFRGALRAELSLTCQYTAPDKVVGESQYIGKTGRLDIQQQIEMIAAYTRGCPLPSKLLIELPFL